MPLLPIAEFLAQFKNAIDAEGLNGALRYLNARTEYRYTAVYRLDGQMMHNVGLYDRLGKHPAALLDVQLGESFCQFVMPGQGFATENAAHDARLAGHPYQAAINAYVGLPLSRQPGTIYGTLCHFDGEPKALPDDEFALLEAAVPLLMDCLP